MKTVPILFSTLMVQAIMADRKTQTRRLIKSNHESGMFRIARDNDGNVTEVTSLDWDHRPKNENSNDIKPICKIDDILWVRETWFSTRIDFADLLSCGVTSHLKFKADNNYDPRKDCVGRSWKPSIFMPKAAARNFLQLDKIRVERLHDISEDDAKAEGAIQGIFRMGPNTEKKQFQFEQNVHGTYRDGFKYIWCLINGLESWESNPYVWAYNFKRVDKPENFI